MKAIKENESPKLEGEFTESFKDFVSLCLVKDPESWPTSLELLKHPFINHSKRISILMDLLNSCPVKEISYEEGKSETQSQIFWVSSFKSEESFKQEEMNQPTVIGKKSGSKVRINLFDEE